MPHLVNQNLMICLEIWIYPKTAQALGSKLKTKNLLAPGTNFFKVKAPWTGDYFLHLRRYINGVFQGHQWTYQLVWCRMQCFWLEAVYWLFEIFPESCVTLIGKATAPVSIPVAHSIQLLETYDNLKLLLNSMSYKTRGWLLCGLGSYSFLLGLQAG